MHHASMGAEWPDGPTAGGRGRDVFVRPIRRGGELARKRKRVCCNQTFPEETRGMARLDRERSEMEGRA